MSNPKLTITVPEELDGKRLDQVLAALCPEHSRARLQGWIKSGHVKVNNRLLRQRDAVKTGETIEIIPIYAPPTQLLGEDIPLDIVYADAAIIILDKPAGLIVHPGAGNPKQTLLNALLYYDPTLQMVPRAGIVQRLDKETSGIMVVARTPPVHTYLVDQLQRRNIRREYEAIVAGVMTAGGKVEAPIGRHPTQRTRMAVVERGKTAVTHYRVLKRFSAHTYLRLKLETGRTHQIRVHMAHIRHPIVGDPVYGGRMRLPKGASEKLREALQSFPRQALHACSLGLIHPDSGEEMSWTIPLPEDMQSLLNILEHEER